MFSYGPMPVHLDSNGDDSPWGEGSMDVKNLGAQLSPFISSFLLAILPPLFLPFPLFLQIYFFFCPFFPLLPFCSFPHVWYFDILPNYIRGRIMTTSGLVCKGFHNKLPQTQHLQVTCFYSIVLEARSLKVSQYQVFAPSGGSWRCFLVCLIQLLDLCSLHPLALFPQSQPQSIFKSSSQGIYCLFFCVSHLPLPPFWDNFDYI